MDRRFDLVVFDLDGVLIDSIEVMEAAFFMAFDRVNKDNSIPYPKFSEYKKHLGLGFPKIIELMQLPRSMHSHFKEASNSMMDKIHIFPGILEMCKKLYENDVKMSIATGKDGVRARKLIRYLNLDTYFPLVLGSDDVENPKPGPDMILKSMNHYGINDPKRVLMCGDAVSDLQSGRAANVKVLSVDWGEGESEDLRALNPDFFVYDPDELMNVVLRQKREVNV